MENTSWSVESREALAAAAVSFAALMNFQGAAACRAEHSDADGAELTGAGAAELAGGRRAGLAGGAGAELAGAGAVGLAGGGGVERVWEDPMLDLVDDSLDGLALLVVMESQFAAFKVHLTADCVKGTQALAAPAGSLRKTAVQQAADEASVQAERGCQIDCVGGGCGRWLIGESLWL